MDVNPEFWNYTATGLLALVLAAIGIFLREYLKRTDKARAESDAFTRDLVRGALETQRENIRALQELVKAVAVLQVTVMSHGERLDEQEVSAQARHAEVMRRLGA